MARNKRNQVRFDAHEITGQLNYLLEVFGDTLGKSQGWKNNLSGLEAVRYYLMQKHHWLPRDVQTMSMDDLHFAMTEEMSGWKAPKDAV